MAGKVATIVSLGLDKPYTERIIVKALKSVRGVDVRVQPAGNGYGYLVVGAKLKANAVTAFDKILAEYKALGGIEYNTDVLPDNAPKPEMAGISDAGVEVKHYESKSVAQCLAELDASVAAGTYPRR
jgi:hypothetical protein